MIHAIGDAAVRAALDVLTPFAATSPLMPRIEHVQMLHPDDRPRFAAAGIAASVQPVHLGSDAIQAWKLWGDRAEAEGYTWKAIADTGAVMAFGTDAPVESYDPWPGLALAVRREDARWPAGTPAFAPEQALTLERALRAQCIDGPVSARELDRGRLTVGQRADVVVIPAASLDEPVTPGGPLSTTRPEHGADGREGRLRGLGPVADRQARVSASANRPLKIRDVDGKAWMVSARTSIVTWAWIASTHSWIAADASGQAIAAPTSSRDPRSTTIVTWPSLASSA